jgi:mRNA interferase RelE/StbE
VEKAVIYRLLYHPLVAEDIERMPQNLKNRIENALQTRLLVDPIKAGRPLRQSLAGHRKMRVGDYRIIYRVKDNMIIVLKIGHRKDVYNKVTPRLQSK